MAAIPSLLAESPEALSVSKLKAGLRISHDLPVQELEAVLPVAQRAAVTAPAVTSAPEIQQPFGWATIADDRLLEYKGLVWPKMRTRRR